MPLGMSAGAPQVHSRPSRLPHRITVMPSSLRAETLRSVARQGVSVTWADGCAVPVRGTQRGHPAARGVPDMRGEGLLDAGRCVEEPLGGACPARLPVSRRPGAAVCAAVDVRGSGDGGEDETEERAQEPADERCKRPEAQDGHAGPVSPVPA